MCKILRKFCSDTIIVLPQAARDRQNLQKCYYLFISSLVNNDAVEVISSQGDPLQVMSLIMLCDHEKLNVVDVPIPGCHLRSCDHLFWDCSAFN